MHQPRALHPAILARPVAHRGLHDKANGIIENTASAFRAAIAQGYGIECDLQASRDGEAMVFHDFTLDRLTEGSGRVDALSARELAGIGFREGGDRIGTLADLFDLVDGEVALVVEVKSGFDGERRIIERIAELAKRYTGPLVFKSFDPGMLIALRAAGIAQPLGIVGMARYEYPDYLRLEPEEKHALANLLHFNETRPDFLSWHHEALPSAAPFLSRSVIGLPLMSWTIRSEEAAERARPHIDQIVFEGFRPAAKGAA
jgi:glycerophosphoryl diester phosphodiesterase